MMNRVAILQRIRPAHLVARMDSHMKEALSGALLAFLMRGAGAGLAFAFNVVLARLLGAEGAGLYFLALSATTIGAVVARMGLDNTLLRFIASSASQGDWGRVKGVHALGMKVALFASVLVSAATFVLAPLVSANVFGKPALTEVIRWMSLGVISFSFMMLLAESLKGLKRIRNSMLVSGVIYPLVGLLLIWPMVRLFGLVGASVTYVLATGLAALAGWVFWRNALRPHGGVLTPFPSDELFSSSRPLWLMALINQAVLPWAPLLLLGVWGTTEESGIFGAATRVAMLVTFFLVSVNTILAPKFAELYARGDIATLGQLASRFALIITVLASPLLFLLVFKGDWVMGLFGEGFERGGAVLAILALGQAVNTLTGPVGYLLMMSGHESDMRNSAILASGILLALALGCIPTMGMLGAAIAAASAIAGMNIFSMYLVWKRLHILVVPLMAIPK